MNNYLTPLVVVFHLALLGLFLSIYMRSRKMKRLQNTLVEKLKGKRYWRINLASPDFFARFLRVMPFEAKGVLIDDDDAYRIQGYWLKSGKAFESKVPKTSCTVEWLGNRSLRSGNLFWARLSTPKGPILFCPDTGMNALPSREQLADLFRSAFPQYRLTDNEKAEFALEKNPRSLSAMAVFFALLLFSLLDSFVFSEFELADAQILQILTHPITLVVLTLGSLAGTTLLYRFFVSGTIPARESLVLAMMLATITQASVLPVLKRVDQALSPAPSQDYAYVVTATGHLKALDPSLGLPAMRFKNANEYWAQYPVDSAYSIPLLRGPIGLWQLDHTRFDPPVVAFYEREDEKNAGKTK